MRITLTVFGVTLFLAALWGGAWLLGTVCTPQDWCGFPTVMTAAFLCVTGVVIAGLAAAGEIA